MDVFHIFLAVMTGIAVIVFVALYFVKAGYGMFFDAKWGRPINNRIGWVLMEAPVFIAMALFWYFSDRGYDHRSRHRIGQHAGEGTPQRVAGDGGV